MDDNIASILSIMVYFKVFSAAFLTAVIVVIIKAVDCDFFLIVKSKNNRKVMRKRFMLVIFVVTLILISAPDTMRVFQDRKKADQLVTYCEDYKQKYGNYPEKLEDMVPEYFDEDRLKKLEYDKSDHPPSFHYFHHIIKDEDYYVLWYLTGVPFHTNDYRFDEKKWVHRGM